MRRSVLGMFEFRRSCEFGLFSPQVLRLHKRTDRVAADSGSSPHLVKERRN